MEEKAFLKSNIFNCFLNISREEARLSWRHNTGATVKTLPSCRRHLDLPWGGHPEEPQLATPINNNHQPAHPPACPMCKTATATQIN